MEFPSNLSFKHAYSLAQDEIDYLIRHEILLSQSSPFVITYSREHLNRSINKYLKQVSKHYQVELKSHSFRINVANEIIKKADIYSAKELLGHSNISTTQKYVRGTFSKEQKAALYEHMVKTNSPSEGGL